MYAFIKRQLTDKDIIGKWDIAQKALISNLKAFIKILDRGSNMNPEKR